MARPTIEQVRHVAQLAALELTDAEAALLCDELGSILEHMAALCAIDVVGVEPTFHPVPVAAPLRADELVPSLPRNEALAAAPESDHGGFAVPRVMEGDG
jgi:aspartyl-tRNA(Asn)/glutamyl-tRNA(Gln) amidotransferase subunit C